MRGWIFSLTLCFVSCAPSQTETYRAPLTLSEPEQSFRYKVSQYLDKYEIPGASISYYARGSYHSILLGNDDVDGNPIKPDSLFRLASCSKPITALGILNLVSSGALKLDDKVLSVLGKPLDSSQLNSQQTIAHLLNHSGGWNREEMGTYPLSREQLETLDLDFSSNISHLRDQLLDHYLSQPLQFEPGKNFSYSSLGYVILGSVIEKVSGMKYGTFIQEKIFAPFQVNQLALGKTRWADRLPNEVVYNSKLQNIWSIYPDDRTSVVPAPYGLFSMRLIAATAGWVSSANDFTKFLVEAANTPAYAPMFQVSNDNEPYSLGMTAEHLNGHLAYACEGALAGSTTLGLVFDKRAAITVLTNGEGDASELLNIVLDADLFD
jgi:CubicO group peptidase (beta-lactamase class C family)